MESNLPDVKHWKIHFENVLLLKNFQNHLTLKVTYFICFYYLRNEFEFYWKLLGNKYSLRGLWNFLIKKKEYVT